MKSKTKPASRPRNRVPIAAHDCESWDIEHWPSNVYPHDVSGARYLTRAYRDELILAGVMTRVGKKLVFFGREYRLWLKRRAHRVVVPTDLAGAARAAYERRRCGEEPQDIGQGDAA